MSYSRWSNSVWYTFWCTTDSKEMNEQLFDVCGVKSFTYAQLKEDLDKCIEDLKETVATDDKMFCAKEYTDLEYEELKLYMKKFIIDVEDEYK